MEAPTARSRQAPWASRRGAAERWGGRRGPLARCARTPRRGYGISGAARAIELRGAHARRWGVRRLQPLCVTAAAPGAIEGGGAPTFNASEGPCLGQLRGGGIRPVAVPLQNRPPPPPNRPPPPTNRAPQPPNRAPPPPLWLPIWRPGGRRSLRPRGLASG